MNGLQREIVDAAGELAVSLSLARSIGEIYALLYIAKEPLSHEDICRLLPISKGNASMNLRVLEDWEAVERVLIKGSRRAHYRALRDLERIALRRVEQGGKKRLDWAEQRLGKLRQGHAGDDAFTAERLSEMKALLKRARKALELLPKIESLLSHPLAGALKRAL